jgi:hypothetical protein
VLLEARHGLVAREVVLGPLGDEAGQLVDDLAHHPEVDAARLLLAPRHHPAHAVLLDDGLGGAALQDGDAVLGGTTWPMWPSAEKGFLGGRSLCSIRSACSWASRPMMGMRSV